MTASSFTRDNKRLLTRAKLVGTLEAQMLANFAQALALALPLALLFTTGWPLALGIAYCVFYGVIMLIPTAVYVLMIFDAGRVLVRRTAVFLPLFVAVGKMAPHKDAGGGSFITLVLRCGITGNVLATLNRELWLLAFRFNPQALKQIEEGANHIAKQLDRTKTGMTGRLVAVEVRTVPHHAGAVELVTC